jgi:hypothetical protein
MLTSILKKPIFFNQELHNYCLKSTNDSIKRMSEKYEKERKNPKISLNLNQDSCPSDPNKNSAIAIICFLSVSSFLYYFYNSKR